MKLSGGKTIAALLISLAVGVGSYTYLHDQPMRPAPQKKGKVLCDLHAHPRNDASLEQLVQLLGSPGLVGLAQRPNNTDVLTYEEAVQRLRASPYARDLEEITPGQLARFQQGYFVRTEEVVAGKKFHFLALGWKGEYFPHFSNPTAAINAIHAREGLVMLNHPYAINNGFGFRLPTATEEQRIAQVCAQVDLVEVHNAHNIRTYVPAIDNMRVANNRAAALVTTHCQGRARQRTPAAIFSSDAHFQYDQVKITGVYVPAESLTSLDDFKQALQENVGGYKALVSRYSFLQGILLTRIGNFSSDAL